MRFSQILRNFDFVNERRDPEGTPMFWTNEFNVEPMYLLERVKRAIENSSR